MIKDPLINLKIKFPENTYPFYMDMGFYRNIPSGVAFKISKKTAHDNYDLVAKGYGTKGDYGNGSIAVSKDIIIKILAQFYKQNA